MVALQAFSPSSWDAAALVIDHRRSIAEVARELGVVEQTLGNRVRSAVHRRNCSPPPSPSREESCKGSRDQRVCADVMLAICAWG
jgi:transposase-like protein